MTEWFAYILRIFSVRLVAVCIRQISFPPYETNVVRVNGHWERNDVNFLPRDWFFQLFHCDCPALNRCHMPCSLGCRFPCSSNTCFLPSHLHHHHLISWKYANCYCSTFTFPHFTLQCNHRCAGRIHYDHPRFCAVGCSQLFHLRFPSRCHHP